MKTIKMVISILVVLIAAVFAIKYRKTIKNKAIEATKHSKGLCVRMYTWLKEAK